MLKLLIGLMQNSTALFLQHLIIIMLFGTDLNTSRNNELKLNYCLLFAKYYLYYQKMYYKACNITEFVLKLEQKLLIESRLKRKIFV